MRIGIDGACWTNGRGYGRYARELLGTMVDAAPDEEFVFFLDSHSVPEFELTAPNARRIVVDLGEAPGEAASSDGRRSVPDLLRLTRAVARSDVDVFFFPSVYSYFPLAPGVRVVVGIHDVIADRYPHLTFPTRRARWFWKAKVALALRQADAILTVSEFSAREIARHFELPPGRIRVAGEAPARVFEPSDSEHAVRQTARRYGLPDDAEWFLYVGGFNPHKRVDALVRAHAELLAGNPGSDPFLVLVGATRSDVFHRYDREVRREIERLGTTDRVVWTGFVPDPDLRHLYSGALAAVLPSQEEGFGLPAVEAAACGTPVIATTRSPLPELLEGGGIFVDPGDEAALGRALRRLHDDPDERTRMGRVGHRRTRSMSWSEGAEEALSVLKEAAA